MNLYNYTETYNTKALLVHVEPKTGSISQPNGTINTHTVSFYIDDIIHSERDDVTNDTILKAIADGIKIMKDDIDGIADTELDAILRGGTIVFSADNQVSTPDNFISAPGVSAGDINLTFDVDPDVDNYVWEKASTPDYASPSAASTTTSPVNTTGWTPGNTIYFRIKAQISGQTDSEWAYANAVAP